MAWPPTTHGDVEDAVTQIRDAGLLQQGATSGIYYTTVGTWGTTAGTTVDQVGYTPVWIPTCTVDRLAVRVATAATGGSGGVVRVGLYTASASTLAPDSLLLDAGTASTETATTKEFTVSLSVTAGLYYLAAVTQVATCTTTMVAVGDALPGTGLTVVGGSTPNGYRQNSVSGALPSTATPTVAAASFIRSWYRRA